MPDSLSDAVQKIWGAEWKKAVLSKNPTAHVITMAAPDKSKILGGDEHHDRIFWKYLVGIGWRKHQIEADGWGGAIQIIITHEPCGKVLDSRNLNGLSDEDAKRLGSTGYVTKLISKHKASSKGCNPEAIPEDEGTVTFEIIK